MSGKARRSRFSLSSLLPLAGLAVFGGFLYRSHLQEMEQYRAQEAAAAVETAERAKLFARGEFPPAYDLCREAWRAEFGFYHEPSALAWTRRGIDGYFLGGVDLGSWRQMRCDAEGARRGPRVQRPEFGPLPAEASPGLEGVAEENWRGALEELAHTPLTGGLLAVELLPYPATGEVIRRRWSGLEGGAGPTVQPPGAPEFPALIAEPPFAMAPGAAPPGLRALPKHHWGKQAAAAFAVLAEVVPAGAGIVELDLTEDRIEVSIEHPTPAFEGNPPAPYGDLDLDEYGIAGSDWWYPRTDPGFGCRKGRPLAEVREEYLASPSAKASWRAWYSCSPAYSDGQRGVWHFFTE